MLHYKGLKDHNNDNNNIKAHIGNIEITWVPESAPLGVSKTKSLYDPVVRQSLFLCCRDACVCEVVPCKVSTGKKNHVYSKLRITFSQLTHSGNEAPPSLC